MISDSATTAITQLPANVWMPEPVSTYAGDIDFAFYFVYWISVFFTLLIAALVVFFAVKRWDGGKKGAEHGHGGRGKLGKGPSHNTALEMTWTIIPLLIVIAIFVFGFRGFLTYTTAPDNAYEIVVQATKWQWSFQYPNGRRSQELHVPVDEPIRLVLTAPGDGNVIHSFWVPQLRTKRDVVPGRYNKTWFEATRTGEFPLRCTEYCGQGHSDMTTTLVVQTREDFAEWVKPKAPSGPPAEIGEELITGRGGCTQCHSLDGSIIQAPSFKDLYGREEPLASGETVIVDEEYVKESILHPQRKIAAGYQSVNMPSFQGILSEQDIQHIIAYLKTHSKHYEGSDIEQLLKGDGDGGDGDGESDGGGEAETSGDGESQSGGASQGD